MFVDTDQPVQEMARAQINSLLERMDKEMGNETHVMRGVGEEIEIQIDALREEIQRRADDARAKQEMPPSAERILRENATIPGRTAKGLPLADLHDITKEPQVLFPMVPPKMDQKEGEQLVTKLLVAIGANTSDDRGDLADNPTLKKYYPRVDALVLQGRTGGQRIEGITTNIPGVTLMYETLKPNQVWLAMDAKTVKDMLDTPALR